MRKPVSPCYKCKFHASTCHANCGFYQKFHDDLEEWNAIIRNGKNNYIAQDMQNMCEKLLEKFKRALCSLFLYVIFSF